MKMLPMVLGTIILVGGTLFGSGIVHAASPVDSLNANRETVRGAAETIEIAAAPDVSDSAAVAHLAAYFDALHAEFPPRPDAAANMLGVMNEGSEIAQSFFPGNQGKLMRALIQSLTQFATVTPDSWEFESIDEAGDTSQIVVNFKIGNASMVKLGIGSSKVRYTLRRDDGSWTLMSAEANLQQ